MQREGLGAEFLIKLDDFFNSLLRNPLIYAYYEKPVRQGKTNHFPYTVVYEFFDEIIVVYSVFMTKQDLHKKEWHNQFFPTKRVSKKKERYWPSWLILTAIPIIYTSEKSFLDGLFDDGER